MLDDEKVKTLSDISRVKTKNVIIPKVGKVSLGWAGHRWAFKNSQPNWSRWGKIDKGAYKPAVVVPHHGPCVVCIRMCI